MADDPPLLSKDTQFPLFYVQTEAVAAPFNSLKSIQIQRQR
jgi:hypothetical protein